MRFFSVDSAVAWIKGKLASFDQIGLQLREDLIKVGQLITQAKNKNKPVAPIRDLQIKIRKTLTDHINLENRLLPFREYFGLGALPVIIAAVAIPLAGILYLHFQKASNHRKSLELIERGMLTVGEAQALAKQPMFGFGLQTAFPIIVIGAGLLLLTMKR